MKRLAALALLTLAACGGADDRKAGEAVIARFHTALNAGDYRTIDTLLSPEARALRPTLGTARAFARIGARYGRYLGGQADSITDETVQGRRFTRMRWAARFAAGPVTEEFTLAERQGALEIHGYTATPGR